MGYCEEEDAICQTQQCRRAEGHYQSNLGCVEWMYTLYKFHFLNGISEINKLFDDILIIWSAPVYSIYFLGGLVAVMLKSCNSFSVWFSWEHLEIWFGVNPEHICDPLNIAKKIAPLNEASQWMKCLSYEFCSKTSSAYPRFMLSVKIEILYTKPKFCHETLDGAGHLNLT